MYKLFVMICLCIGLAACQQEVLTVPKNVPFNPPAGFTVCNLQDLPKEFRDDKEVATFLAQVYSDNKICYYNMEAIKKLIAKQKKVIK